MRKEDLQLLATAPVENAFCCADGSEARTVQQLEDVLETMDEDTFSHHVQDGRNDFAQWVTDIIGHADLAKELQQARSREEARDTIHAAVARVTDTLLSHTSESAAFHAQDGQTFYSLHELEHGLRQMDRNTYQAHSRTNDNDFGNWVQHVFGDTELAATVTQCRNKTQAANAVRRRIEQLHALQRSSPVR